MVLCKAQIGARTITFKVFRGLKTGKPTYTVVLSSNGTIRAYKRGHGEVGEGEVNKIMTNVFTHVYDSAQLRQAIQLLRGKGMNIAFACGLVTHASDAESIADWITSLPEKYRGEATQAHSLLLASLDGYPRSTVGQIAPLAKGV